MKPFQITRTMTSTSKNSFSYIIAFCGIVFHKHILSHVKLDMFLWDKCPCNISHWVLDNKCVNYHPHPSYRKMTRKHTFLLCVNFDLDYGYMAPNQGHDNVCSMTLTIWTLVEDMTHPCAMGNCVNYFPAPTWQLDVYPDTNFGNVWPWPWRNDLVQRSWQSYGQY